MKSRRLGIAILVLGRGVHIEVDRSLARRDKTAQCELIELVKSGKRVDLIKPTNILELAVPGKHYKQGVHGPERHPTFGWHVKTGKAEPMFSRYAGSILNVEATVKVANKLVKDSAPLQKIYWAAGRTSDMDLYAPPGWSQGIVLAKAFLNKVSTQVKESNVSMALEPDNQDTWDDLAVSFLDAALEGYEEVIVIAVGVHIARSYRMIEVLTSKIEEFIGKGTMPHVTYVASEAMLRNDPAWWREIKKAAKSRGYKLTMQRENHGREAMRNGTHRINSKDIKTINKRVVNMSMSQVRDFS